MMKRIFLTLLTAGMLMFSQYGFCGQRFNFSKGENVGEEDLLSPYKEGKAIMVRHDSTFIAELNEDGSVKTLTYTEEFSRIQPDGQVAYCDKTGTVYYSKAGKLFTAKQNKKGKWIMDKDVKIAGSGVERDKYPGSVLAYANWRYMPNDSVVILNPTINEDGTEMYFASNMLNSKKLDIWKVKKDPDGGWGIPSRLGNNINTEEDENYPHLRPDGTISFASTKKVGNTPEKGKYNVYVADAYKSTPPRTYAEVNGKETRQLLAEKNSDQEKQQLDEEIAQKGERNDSLLTDITDKYEPKENQGNDETNPSSADEKRKEFMEEIERVNKLAQREPVTTTVEEKPENRLADHQTSKEEVNKIKQLDDKLKSRPDSVVRLSQNVLATHNMRIFYFEFDKDIPNGTYDKDLLIVLDFINAYPDSKFLIVGHTDERGTYEYNDALSLKRAEWVRFHLLLKGVKLDRLQIRGDGEYHPIIKNAKTEEEHQRNRRAEVIKLN